jgi:hypothetical protein
MKWLFLLLLLLSSCAQLAPEEQDYKTVCLAHKDAFMKMNEMKDGETTGPPCYGCMPDIKNHICSKDEYLKYITKD